MLSLDSQNLPFFQFKEPTALTLLDPARLLLRVLTTSTSLTIILIIIINIIMSYINNNH